MFMGDILFYGLVGGVSGGIVVFLIALLQKPKFCPRCKTKLPKFRIPNNLHQALLGGGICPNCGCEMDRKGVEIVKTD
jgi:hypothetical protein